MDECPDNHPVRQPGRPAHVSIDAITWNHRRSRMIIPLELEEAHHLDIHGKCVHPRFAGNLQNLLCYLPAPDLRTSVFPEICHNTFFLCMSPFAGVARRR